MSAHESRTRQLGSSHAEVRRALAIKRGQWPGRLLIDGVWAHRAALDAGVPFDTVFSVPELLHSDEALSLEVACRLRADQSYRISTKIIERFSDRHRPDGLVSIIEAPRWNPDRILLPPDALVVVADGLQSPGNLGTVIRTIDACRADLLIVTNAHARSDGDKVFQGSRGLSLTVPQLVVDQTAIAIEWLEQRSVSIMVADANGGLPYALSDLRRSVALVIGNERHGPSQGWHRFPRIRIPMLGRADSLNVAVSAGVLLYHARAQREGW